MKIIHIVLGKANPQRMNGVNKMVHQLASAQWNAGEQVEVWGLTEDPKSAVARRGFRTRLFAQQKRLFRWDRRILSELQAETEPVIVHFHGGFIPEFSRIGAALRANAIPYCLTAHGAYNIIAMEKSKWVKKLYFRLFERGLLRGARAVHCIGASEAVALANLLPSAHSVLIPNGHEVPPTTVPVPASNDSVPTFGFCGRLRAHTKGLDIILDAFATYRKALPGRLLIIGDGEDREALHAKATQLGLGNDVEFTGAKYGAEKDSMLSCCDIFLHPSRNEGMPGAVLEAAGQGIPVIVSEATNLAGAVADAEAGIALQQNDAPTLAQAMARSATARQAGELAFWAVNAKKMVETTFAWPRIAGLFNQMYQA